MYKLLKIFGITIGGVGSITAITVPLSLNKGEVHYLTLANNQITQNSKSKHYFLIMADSMASFKMQAVLQKENLEKKFNGWRLNMNVVTSGYGTETGLPGVVGGAKFNPVIAQSNSMTLKENIKNAYDSLFTDLSNSSSIDKIYVSNPEYYKTTATKWFGSRDIKDPKHKIEYIDGSTRDNIKVNDFAIIANQIKANENNFTYLVSDIAHRNDYGGYYSHNGGLVNALTTLTDILKKRKMYDDSTILVVSDHGRPMEKNTDFQGDYINKYRNFKYKEYTPSGGRNKITSLATPSFSMEEKHFNDSLSPTAESILENMSGMFYKPLKQTDSKSIEYDYKNLWASYDARSVIYKDLNITNKNWEFTLNKSGLFNNNPFNSFIEDPMHSPQMETRRLLSMNKNHSWGIHDSVHYGKDAIVFNGAFFGTYAKPIERYIFEKIDRLKGETTFLEKKTISSNIKNPGSGQIEFEKFIDGFINNKKIT